MIKLPAPRLLPTTILATAALLGIKAATLSLAAMASDPPPGSTIAPNRLPAGTIVAAKPPAQPPHPGATTHAATAPRSGTAADPTPPDWSLLQDLRARRADLDGRAHDLDLRQAAMMAEQARLTAQLASLTQAREELKRLETARQQRTEASWDGMVKLYEAMKPADAAAIFDTLELHLAVQLFDRMNARKAAAIMGDMDPDRARVATQALAVYRVRRDADPLAAVGSATDKPPGAG